MYSTTMTHLKLMQSKKSNSVNLMFSSLVAEIAY